MEKKSSTHIIASNRKAHYNYLLSDFLAPHSVQTPSKLKVCLPKSFVKSVCSQVATCQWFNSSLDHSEENVCSCTDVNEQLIKGKEVITPITNNNGFFIFAIS